MRRTSWIPIGACAVLVFAWTAGTGAADQPVQQADAVPPDEQSIGGSIDFAFDLFREAAKDQGNVVFSPQSVEAVLALFFAGAGGTTEEELSRVLHRPARAKDDDRKSIEFDRAKWVRLNRSGEGFEVATATHLWRGADGEKFDKFIEDASKGSIRSTKVDFSNPSAVLEQINEWGRQQTRGKLGSLLTELPDPATTSLIVTNAVYFSARWGWEDAFLEKHTAPGRFFVPDRERGERSVPMMLTTLTTRYAHSDGLQMIELPYQGKEYSAWVLLPDWDMKRKPAELTVRMEKLVASLSAARWKRLIEGLKETKLRLQLPRFTVSESIELRGALGQMGIREAFSPGANFSKMAEGPLYLSRIAHRAIMEVDEKGTVAAAATTGVARSGITPLIKVDHPFLFLIRHSHDGSILFLARIDDPESGR